GEAKAAGEAYAEALALRRGPMQSSEDDGNHRRAVALTLMRLGDLALEAGNVEVAALRMGEARSVLQPAGEGQGDGGQAEGLALVRQDRAGRILMARARGEEALQVFRDGLTNRREIAAAEAAGPRARF